MSDPLAVSILAKLTSWYAFNSDFTDSHGSNSMTSEVAPGFAAGKVGNYLLTGARAYKILAAAIPYSATTGTFSLGGWFYYTTSIPNVAPFGLTTGAGTTNEVLYISNQTSGAFKAFGWRSGGSLAYQCLDPNPPEMAYPLTVRVEDSAGSSATSAQVVRIANTVNLTQGWYFVVATWNLGVITLYVDAEAKATHVVPSTNATSATYLQVANKQAGTISDAGLDECFLCGGSVMTAAEVTWLYNAGAGRSYAAIVALAA